ncbi:MAG: T9SS type A sorting domain-containing protein [Bacteroidales bacterium]
MRNLLLTLFVFTCISGIFSQEAGPRDRAPQINTDLDPLTRDAWDVQFNFPVDTAYTQTGIETDGTYLYCVGWNDERIVKYDLQGNVIGDFTIPGAYKLRDLAYDGQYFYSGLGFENLMLVMDFTNEVLVDSIPLSFSFRAMAYDHDLDVFYANNWSTDITIFEADGTIVGSIDIGDWEYKQFYGFAYDGWSDDGPFLWGFSQDGLNGNTLVQIKLPEGTETGFVMDLTPMAIGSPYTPLAGGLFTHENLVGETVTLGGLMQNNAVFGLELGDAFWNPPVDSCYGPVFLHAALKDSMSTQLTWGAPQFAVLNENFEGAQFPPQGWSVQSQGNGWKNGDTVVHAAWEVPRWDSHFAYTDDIENPSNGCCDYLVTPALIIDHTYDFYLKFESYYNGAAGHEAYVKYSLDDGTNWELLHTLSPQNEWASLNIDLSLIQGADSANPIRFAFHSDDGQGDGSGWVIDNVLVHSDNVLIEPNSYQVFRDGSQVNYRPVTGLSYLDEEIIPGTYEYEVYAIYDSCSQYGGPVYIEIPDRPAPPPYTGPCLPPENLQAGTELTDVLLRWNSPMGSIRQWKNAPETDPFAEFSPESKRILPNRASRESWDVQFQFPVAVGGGEAGVETDGNFIYTSEWNGDNIHKYSLDGTHMGTFSFPLSDNIRDMAYVESEGYFYGTNGSNQIIIMDFETLSFIGNLVLSANARGIAYDNDLDAFYVNNWSTDIMLIDRETGSWISSFPTGLYGSYYGFAYDHWTDGGPYLWGFSQDGIGYATLVQIALPSGLETGFTMDLSFLSTSGTGLAGGLYTQPDMVPGTVTLGGVIQNETIFGLELGEAVFDQFLEGYNVYRDASLLNSLPVQDTFYLDEGLAPGTYSYEATAVYVDSLGVPVCESEPAGPVEIEISNGLVLGGNVFAGTSKLEEGFAYGYQYTEGEVVSETVALVDDLGYYFFFPFSSNDYYVKIKPAPASAFYDDYIPTYYGDVIHWEDAGLIQLTSNIYNADIRMLPFSSGTSGPASIHGLISREEGSGATSPAPDVPVMLFNEAGECVALDYSGAQGAFEFNGIGHGTYGLLAEMVGKRMDPVHFTLDDQTPSAGNIHFLIQHDQIVLGMDDPLPGRVEFISEIYPNPAREHARIRIDLKEKTLISFSVYDARGKQVRGFIRSLESGPNTFSLDLSDMDNGLYYVLIVSQGERIGQQKLIISK